jgi:hypothetical protein
MKRIAIAAILLTFGFAAQAAKPCEELKSEIAAKLDASNVKGYALDIVAKDQVGTAKVVGSCEGGAKKITYAKKK